MAGIIRLTETAKEWMKRNPGKSLVKWEHGGQPFIFEGDFYHHGVSLKADEVLNIMADHIFSDANIWQAKWNEDPDRDFFRFAGIEFIGPVEGRWWEEKGTRPPQGRRYHKFGGAGTAYVLTYP